MAWSFILFPWLIALSALFLFTKFLLKSRTKLRPPGPPGLPLVGNIFDLGEIPHQTFYQLQAKYGPVLWLKLGVINTLVVQSAETAAELFKKCDLPFADRKTPDSLTALDYYQGSIAIGAYRDYWRRLRRICITEFLVHKRVDASISIRRNCVEKTVKWIKEDVEKSKKNGGSGEIELDGFLFINSFNMIGNLMLSREVMESKLDKAGEFFDAFVLFLEWCGKPNFADCFPFLKWADPQRIRMNTEKYLGRLLGFAGEIVKERIQEKQSGKMKERNDFLDALLDEEDDVKAEGRDKLSVKNVTIVLLLDGFNVRNVLIAA
ncbi:Iridoid oxidase [Sesamum alatum]|uniref:Iridoid oxidase n=1 Tax=Sesamum alatum TaxID=300844 RepID=A0AAE2CEN3_9LAMI|nr:Iridoid oxidase [Sesamum alatum]